MKLVNISDCIIEDYYNTSQQYPLTNKRLMALYFLSVRELLSSAYVHELHLEPNEDLNFVATKFGPVIEKVRNAYPLTGTITQKNMADKKSMDKLNNSSFMSPKIGESDLDWLDNFIYIILENSQYIDTQKLINFVNGLECVRYAKNGVISSDELQEYSNENDWYDFKWLNDDEYEQQKMNPSSCKTAQSNSYEDDDNNQEYDVLDEELGDFFGYAQKALDKKLNNPDDSIER